MSEEKARKRRYLRLLLAALVVVFVIVLCSILECDMATPAY